jgi:arylsulfatase A
MTRRSFLASSALMAAQKGPAQNVVLIVVDDLGYKDFSCYSTPTHPVPYSTPNVAEMAKQSTVYNRFYAACPVCSPTRVSILTGKYPTRTGITDWIPGMEAPPDSKLTTPETRGELPLAEKTIAEYLKPLGYATASFGKWHLGGAGFSPTDQGFDVNIGGDQKGQPNRFMAPFIMPGLTDAPAGSELTEYLTKLANEWVSKQAEAKKPFFLYLPHFGVHTPLGSSPELVSKYRNESVLNPIYAAMVEAIDNSIGAIRQQLVRSGVSENTLLIVTSDNGALAKLQARESTTIKPLRAQKGYLYEGGIRVPFLMHDPRKKVAAIEERPACSIDILPTILSWLGQSVPTTIDGTPLQNRKESPIYYWHYPHYHGAGGKPSGAVMDGDYKLIEDFETGRTELYDLKADIGETKDLAATDPARRSSLYLRLKRWREQTKAIMPEVRTATASWPQPAETLAQRPHNA